MGQGESQPVDESQQQLEPSNTHQEIHTTHPSVTHEKQSIEDVTPTPVTHATSSTAAVEPTTQSTPTRHPPPSSPNRLPPFVVPSDATDANAPKTVDVATIQTPPVTIISSPPALAVVEVPSAIPHVDPSTLPVEAPSRRPEPPATSTAPASSSSSSSGPVSVPLRATGGPEGIGEEYLDLWYALVEWAAAGLDTGVVLAWDSEEVGHRILALSSSTPLLDTLAVKQAERKRARIAAMKARQAAAEQAARTRDMSNDALIPIELQPLATPAPEATADPAATPDPVFPEPIPFHLASDLLQLDRPLAQLRHVWVPSRVSEDTFWQTYFNAAMDTIIDHVLSLQQPPDQLQDTNPHLDEINNKLKQQRT